MTHSNWGQYRWVSGWFDRPAENTLRLILSTRLMGTSIHYKQWEINERFSICWVDKVCWWADGSGEWGAKYQLWRVMKYLITNIMHEMSDTITTQAILQTIFLASYQASIDHPPTILPTILRPSFDHPQTIFKHSSPPLIPLTILRPSSESDHPSAILPTTHLTILMTLGHGEDQELRYLKKNHLEE